MLWYGNSTPSFWRGWTSWFFLDLTKTLIACFVPFFGILTLSDIYCKIGWRLVKFLVQNFLLLCFVQGLPAQILMGLHRLNCRKPCPNSRKGLKYVENLKVCEGLLTDASLQITL
jgi:hypothetical protein